MPDDLPVYGVLGASGYLGSAFVRFLLDRGERVVCLSTIQSLPQLRRRLHGVRSEPDYVAGTTLSFTLVQSLIAASNIVCNLIGASVLRATRHQAPYLLAVNGVFPGVLARWCRASGQPMRPMFVSSMRVGLIESDAQVAAWVQHFIQILNLDECAEHVRVDTMDRLTAAVERTLLVCPRLPDVDCYELSKLVGEVLVLSDATSRVFRIASVYGPSPGGRGLVHRILRSRLSGRHARERSEVRDFLYEADLCEALTQPPVQCVGPITIASGHRASTQQLAAMIERVTPYGIGRLTIAGEDPGHPVSIGPPPVRPLPGRFVGLEDGLKRTVDGYLNDPIGHGLESG